MRFCLISLIVSALHLLYQSLISLCSNDYSFAPLRMALPILRSKGHILTTTSTTLSNNYCARNNTTSAQGGGISMSCLRGFAWSYSFTQKEQGRLDSC